MTDINLHFQRMLPIASCLAALLSVLASPITAYAQSTTGSQQSACIGNTSTGTTNAGNTVQTTQQFVASGPVLKSSDFTICVPVVLKKLHPGVRAAIVTCEIFFSGMKLPLAQGKEILKPTKGSVNQMVAIQAKFVSGSGPQANAVQAFRSGNYSATPSYRCDLLLSSEESGANGKKPAIGAKQSWLKIAGQTDGTRVQGPVPLSTPRQ